MEQYMMYRKAVCVHDSDIVPQILATDDVARIKELGWLYRGMLTRVLPEGGLLSEQGNFFFIRRKCLTGMLRVGAVGCFQNFWNGNKIRVMDNGMEGVKANEALSDIGVAVLVTTALVFAVVDVKYGNLILSDQTVKLPNHTVKIMHDVIAGIMDVTGVKADAQPVVLHDAVIDCRELFKRSADLGTFSCHCLQCDHAVGTGV